MNRKSSPLDHPHRWRLTASSKKAALVVVRASGACVSALAAACLGIQWLRDTRCPWAGLDDDAQTPHGSAIDGGMINAFMSRYSVTD
eukprot:1040893-Pyramimonas_sp.AAC.1